MKALILAAGYATRLYPLTKDYPKPLLKVGRKPIINYIVEKIRGVKEVDEIIVVTNSRFIPLFRRWAKTVKAGKPISLVDDLTSTLEDRRGAIGDMDFAIRKRRVRDDLLVVGGDNLFDENLDDFLFFSRGKEPYPSIGVYDVGDKLKAKNYGVIKINNSNRIVNFAEKPARPRSSLVAMCLYYFPRAKLNLISRYLKAKNAKRDASGFYIDWLIRKEPVYGFVFDGAWYDIGSKNFYQEAKKNYKQGRF